MTYLYTKTYLLWDLYIITKEYCNKKNSINTKKGGGSINKTRLLLVGVILCLGLFHGISNLDFFTSLKTIVTASKNPKKSSGNPVRFRQQGVQQIEITSLKTKIMKTFIDENDMETITSGIDNAKKKQLLLDEESADMIDCTMRINYKGGSTQTYYIWARNKSKEVVIGRQENLKGLYFESYELNKDYSKKITKLLKNII